MAATAGHSPATGGGREQWCCRCCGYRLGDITPTGVRVVVPHWRREGASLVVRCPHCRRRATLERADLAG